MAETDEVSNYCDQSYVRASLDMPIYNRRRKRARGTPAP